MHIWHLSQISHLQTVWINLFLTFFGSLYNLFSVIKSGGTPFCKALLRKVSAKLLNALPKILHAKWTYKKTQLFNGLMEMYSTSNQWRHLLKLFAQCFTFRKVEWKSTRSRSPRKQLFYIFVEFQTIFLWTWKFIYKNHGWLKIDWKKTL